MIPWVLAAMLLLSSAPQQPPPEPGPPGQTGPDASPDPLAELDLRVAATVVADVLPRQDASELRPQLAATLTYAPRGWMTVRLDAAVEALAADRRRRATAAVLRARDIWAEARSDTADLRGGYGRLVWGRLDEVSPSDVINPLDAAKFLFEGRSEARLAVPFVRGRYLPSERFALEGVLVPRFTRGTFDLLGEDSSPFNLTSDLVLPAGVHLATGRRQIEPQVSWRTISGGARAQATIGKVDVAAAAYRGFDPIGPIRFVMGTPSSAVVGELVETHPRFTMYAADFETVSGSWAWRGEVAVFPDKTFAGVSVPGEVRGRSLDAGLGFDRRAGTWRLFGSALVHHDSSHRDARIERTDISLVGSLERAFRQERFHSRAFAVVNPDDGSGFVRAFLRWKVDDRTAVELSGGAFIGESDDAIGRFGDRDFGVLRLRYDLR